MATTDEPIFSELAILPDLMEVTANDIMKSSITIDPIMYGSIFDVVGVVVVPGGDGEVEEVPLIT